MADDHPSGEVRPVIVRDVLDATETQGASVGMRFCAASAIGLVPPEPCQSLRNGGSSASEAGKMGNPGYEDHSEILREHVSEMREDDLPRGMRAICCATYVRSQRARSLSLTSA
jgi:hypothetical protein